MTFNFPTVIFWDERYFELRDEAIPFYDKLREAGILYYDASEAAEHVSTIFDDPMAWWMQEKVQSAKTEFCQQYAYVAKAPIEEWARELKSQLEN